MGCLQSKSGDQQKYSWSNREALEVNEYTVNNLKSEKIVKSGNINGGVCAISDCENSTVIIMDHINSATVDNCKKCIVFIGPTKASIFIRDCNGCNIMCSSQQLRIRDCNDLIVYSHCPTNPIIESSDNITFGCYSAFYSNLNEQFKKAGLSFFNNLWNQVYDFSANEQGPHWKLTSQDASKYFAELVDLGAGISLDEEDSCVPKTLGKATSNECSLVIFFTDGNREKKAFNYIKQMRSKGCSLVVCKEFQIKEVEAESIFNCSSYNDIVKRGPVIGLVHCGKNCINISQQVATSIALDTGSTGLVYVGGNNVTGQICLIFNNLEITSHCNEL